MSWPPTGPGGVNEAVLGLACALQTTSKFRPIIGVTSWKPIALPPEIRGIPVTGLQLHDGYEEGLWTAVKSAVRLPSDLAALARALKVNDVAIVNVHFPSLGGAAFLLLRRLGLYRGKIALTFHLSDIRTAHSSPAVARLAWKRYIDGADEVFACSQALAAEVQALCPQKEVRVVYNGADIEAFSRVVRIPASGSKRILHIGAYVRNKSHDVLLSALQLLLHRGLDCTLTMMGAPGPTLEEVRQAAAAFGDRVRLLVNVPHERIPEYMANCDLFVLPSRAEGFPIVLIEAGAAGLPVVTTTLGGVKELMTHEKNGLLVEPDNPGALADAMARVLESDELAAALASRLQAKAVHFTWQRAAEQFIAALS